jgi:hypothetical protein
VKLEEEEAVIRERKARLEATRAAAAALADTLLARGYQVKAGSCALSERSRQHAASRRTPHAPAASSGLSTRQQLPRGAPGRYMRSPTQGRP